MKRTAKLFASAICAFSTLASACSMAWAATTITVTADKNSGTYDAPIYVTLKASDPAAKIWYVFDPKAPPGDALPYSKPLRIEKSTPLLFFAYVDKEHESKVERKDYVISPVTLRIEDGVSVANEAKNVTVVLRNFGPIAVSLAGWTLRTDLDARTFSKGAVSIAAGSKADFTLPYSEWAVTLTSPDGEIRSTVTVERLAPKPVETPVSETPKPETVTQPDKGVKIAVKTPDVPTKNVEPVTKPTESPTTATSATSATATESPATAPSEPKTAQDDIPTNPEAVLAAAEPVSPKASETNPDPLAIKASAAESQNGKGARNVAFAALGILAAWVVIRVWSIAKKRRG